MRLASHEGGGAWPGGVGGLPPGPLGRPSLFGDGSHSGNVLQGGSVLLPQNYVFASGNVLPLMSSATVGTVTVTASSIYNATYEAWHACDRTDAVNTNSWVCASTGMPAWWQVRDTSPKPLGGYTLRSTNELNGYPIAWTVKGSNTGAFAGEETLLDSRSGQTWTTFQTRKFLFNAVHTFEYIRFAFSSANSPGSYVEVNEVELLSGAVLENALVVTGAATVVPDAALRGGGALCAALVVDGGTLTLSAAADGLGLCASNRIALVNSGKIHVDSKALGGNIDASCRRLFALPYRSRLSPLHERYAQQQNALALDGALLFLAAPSVSLESGCIVSADGTAGNQNGGRVSILYRDAYTNNGTVRANGYGSGLAGVVTINKA